MLLFHTWHHPINGEIIAIIIIIIIIIIIYNIISILPVITPPLRFRYKKSLCPAPFRRLRSDGLGYVSIAVLATILCTHSQNHVSHTGRQRVVRL
jgi:hypothetical protein